MDLPKKYNFKESEKKWLEYWKKNKIYKFDSKSKKEVYSVDTPPPTVSGKMHIGHASSYAQQDFFVRFQRMKNKNVFFPFGTDDNGLPTERLVERLKKIKSSEIDRKEFIKLCQDTIKEIKEDFIQDWVNLGMSCDFDTTYSTIDNHSIKTSQKSFLELFKKKLVYRGSYPSMWCVSCRTTIAQAELEDKEKDSSFNYVIFKVDNKDVVIATTRPELIGACVCIYVNPKDKNNKNLIGKKARVPLFNYEVPIYGDENVDIKKGTGILMVCSYGDKYDVEAINKRKLRPRVIFTKEGKINSLGGKYKGLKILEARKEIIKDLEKEGLLREKKEIKHVANVHDKCGTEIEFLESKQWFIETLKHKNKFIKLGNKINWYPKFMKQRYVNWIKGLQWDWAISRQRHFGVPFPVWYCKKCGEIKVAEQKQLPVYPLKDKPLTKCKCGSNEFIGEEDVMDTWNTSSLTPEISLDWVKDKTKHYKDVNFNKMSPMSVRPQAHDIIRTWAFYTIVKSLYHQEKVPWGNIVISGHVLNPTGKKMSKSKGDVYDPRDVMEKYGTDALRFWAANNKLGLDIPYKEDEIKNGIRTVTKLWNASKFSLMNLKDFKNTKVELNELDKGFLSKYNDLVKEVNENFQNYEFSKDKALTEGFFWSEFCDNYLEIVKDRIYNPDKRGVKEKKSAQYTLYYVLNGILKMFAPLMPFITEEIYQSYYSKFEKKKSIHISEFPEYDKKLNFKKEENFYDLFSDILSKVRKYKAKHNKSMREEIILTIEEKDYKVLKNSIQDLKAVCNIKEIKKGNFNVSF